LTLKLSTCVLGSAAISCSYRVRGGSQSIVTMTKIPAAFARRMKSTTLATYAAEMPRTASPTQPARQSPFRKTRTVL
jgi:hypothetical protein